MNGSRIKKCTVCRKYQTSMGNWVIVNDLQKLKYVMLFVSVEMIVCPQCLEEQHNKRRIKHVVA